MFLVFLLLSTNSKCCTAHSSVQIQIPVFLSQIDRKRAFITCLTMEKAVHISGFLLNISDYFLKYSTEKLTLIIMDSACLHPMSFVQPPKLHQPWYSFPGMLWLSEVHAMLP